MSESENIQWLLDKAFGHEPERPVLVSTLGVPAPLFHDAALTIPAKNPVRSDAGGRFAAIWIAATLSVGAAFADAANG